MITNHFLLHFIFCRLSGSFYKIYFINKAQIFSNRRPDIVLRTYEPGLWETSLFKLIQHSSNYHLGLFFISCIRIGIASTISKITFALTTLHDRNFSPPSLPISNSLKLLSKGTFQVVNLFLFC